MSIRIVGINHKTAPVAVREKVAFSPQGLIDKLNVIKSAAASANKANEVIILSTCNRTEIYTHSDYEFDEVCQWFLHQGGISFEALQQCVYHHTDKDAVKHVLRVASGLDSMVLGEPQILGQLKSALKTATDQKTAGNLLKHLVQHAFSTAKKVRTQTSIGSNPVSVAYAAVNLAKQIFSTLDNKTALLIGAGETIELVGKHLQNGSIGKIIIANRSIDNANKVASKLGSIGVSLQEISDYLPEADIVISSTAAPVPVIGKGTVEWALKKRKHKPIFMVDIAVPRDIEAEVAELDDVFLYTVDDLQSVIEDNLKSRQEAANHAEVMVTEEVETFQGWIRAQDQMGLIKQYRSKVSSIQEESLQKAKRMLNNGATADEALHFLAHTLSNKMAHDATVAMNTAARAGDHKLLEASDKILNLSNASADQSKLNSQKDNKENE